MIWVAQRLFFIVIMIAKIITNKFNSDLSEIIPQETSDLANLIAQVENVKLKSMLWPIDHHW